MIYAENDVVVLLKTHRAVGLGDHPDVDLEVGTFATVVVTHALMDRYEVEAHNATVVVDGEHLELKPERFYLSDLDRKVRHLEVEERFGGEDQYNCGGWTWDPPCGGCVGCFHMMAAHYFDQERQAASRVQRAGLEYADQSVINTELVSHSGGVWHGVGPHHSLLDCNMAGELSDARWKELYRAHRELTGEPA